MYSTPQRHCQILIINARDNTVRSLSVVMITFTQGNKSIKCRQDKVLIESYGGTNTKKVFNVRYFWSLMSVQTPTLYWVTSKLMSESRADVN